MFPCCIYSHIFSTSLKEVRLKLDFQTFWRNYKWWPVQKFFWVVSGRVNYGCLAPSINVCWDFFTCFIIQWVKITPDLKDSLKCVLLRRLLSVDCFHFCLQIFRRRNPAEGWNVSADADGEGGCDNSRRLAPTSTVSQSHMMFVRQ